MYKIHRRGGAQKSFSRTDLKSIYLNKNIEENTPSESAHVSKACIIYCRLDELDCLEKRRECHIFQIMSWMGRGWGYVGNGGSPHPHKKEIARGLRTELHVY